MPRLPFAAACAAVLTVVSASAQNGIRYVPIDSYQGADCGETDLPACRVRRAWSADTLRARLAASPDGVAIWTSGPDEITFAFGGTAATVGACCSVQIPLSPLDGDPDLWVLSARIPQADRLAMTTAIVVQDSVGARHRVTPSRRWAGPLAPPPPPSAETLIGTLRTDSLQSVALGGARAVTVYLPPTWGTGPRRVVYLADGQWTEAYARVLEPAIAAGRVPPVALVGIHSARDRTPGQSADGRTLEYIAGADSARYAAHERFVLTEVLPWAEQTFGLAATPADRVAFGRSNGAAFAATLVRRHPDVFETAVAFSHAHDGLDAADDPDLSGRRFFLLAGQMEPGFVANQQAVAGRVAARGASVHQEVGLSGHDEVMWTGAFARAAAWALGADVPATAE